MSLLRLDLTRVLPASFAVWPDPTSYIVVVGNGRGWRLSEVEADAVYRIVSPETTPAIVIETLDLMAQHRRATT